MKDIKIHTAFPKFNDGDVWVQGTEYSVHVHVMSDMRLQVFKTARHFKERGLNLRIYGTLEEVFNDFEFDEFDKNQITESYDHIYGLKGEVVS